MQSHWIAFELEKWPSIVGPTLNRCMDFLYNRTLTIVSWTCPYEHPIKQGPLWGIKPLGGLVHMTGHESLRGLIHVKVQLKGFLHGNSHNLRHLHGKSRTGEGKRGMHKGVDDRRAPLQLLPIVVPMIAPPLPQT